MYTIHVHTFDSNYYRYSGSIDQKLVDFTGSLMEPQLVKDAAARLHTVERPSSSGRLMCCLVLSRCRESCYVQISRVLTLITFLSLPDSPESSN